ncbi:hypothetical protein Desaci_1254 [Desulfosporosinus acidiphilus SJ4]|uniref:Uncharacterized protein n=2 Tax=Desulfosporosinus TaxID=79206 RepID=I4D3A8_DESAJ|nr:hypothetical protein Desaci_1254 [Desulfosporosinus acidiphilus SJ4]
MKFICHLSVIENWYAGLLRSIKKLPKLASVDKEIVAELSDEQNLHLTGRTKDLIPLLENLLKLLNLDMD